MMLITLHMQSKTRKHTTWMITTDTQFKWLRIERSAARTMIDTMRYVINLTVGPNNRITFLGNRRISGKWITEWIVT